MSLGKNTYKTELFITIHIVNLKKILGEELELKMWQGPGSASGEYLHLQKWHHCIATFQGSWVNRNSERCTMRSDEY